MICFGDGIQCIPNHSKTGVSLCLSESLRCNGEDDCKSGLDEQDCPILLNGSLKALIALSVIAVIVLIPVIYVIVRKKQGRQVLPKQLQPIFGRMSTCCKSEEGNRSAQRLTSHGSVSTGSDNKDGFTNVGFEVQNTSSNAAPAITTQQYSVTGRPLNKFKQAVHESELERLPSYRDWQAHRLQKTPPSANSPKAGNSQQPNKWDNSRTKNHQSIELNNIRDQSLGDRVQPQAVLHRGPITYAPSTHRAPSGGGGPGQRAPYAIASRDGRANYEAKSHLRRAEESADQAAPGRTHQPSWQQHVTRTPNQYHTDSRETQPSHSNYDSYEQISSAVPPHQLRQALQKVADSPYSRTNYQRDTDHNAYADTVV